MIHQLKISTADVLWGQNLLLQFTECRMNDSWRQNLIVVNNYFVVCDHILGLNSKLSFHISKPKTIKDWKGAVKYSKFWNGESVSISGSRGKLGSKSVGSLFGSVLDVLWFTYRIKRTPWPLSFQCCLVGKNYWLIVKINLQCWLLPTHRWPRPFPWSGWGLSPSWSACRRPTPSRGSSSWSSARCRSSGLACRKCPSVLPDWIK